MALGSCYTFFFQTHFRSVKFKVLPVRHDASNSDRTSYHDFAKRNYSTSSESFTSVTHDFYFWIGSQSVGITFTIQFFQVQLDWSRRSLSLPIEHLFLDSFSSIGWAKWLSLVFCKFTSAWPSLCPSILVFFSIFKLTVFKMLNENFFVTCNVKMHTSVLTKIIEHVKPKVAGRLLPNSFICLTIS